jgi:hypothetical protein
VIESPLRDGQDLLLLRSARRQQEEIKGQYNTTVVVSLLNYPAALCLKDIGNLLLISW